MDAPTRLTPSPPNAYIDVTNPVTLGWENPTPSQAYELKVFPNELNASPYWVASDGTLSASQQTPSQSGTIGSATVSANQFNALSYGYQWKVKYCDSSGSWSPWSSYSRLFTSVTPPTVVVTEPSSSGTTSNHTRAVFSYTDSVGYSMAAFRVKIYKSNVVVYDTGELSASISSGSSYGYIVTDYTNVKSPSYKIGVLAKNSIGVWSAEAQSSTFTVNLIGLSNPLVSVSDRSNGTVRIDVDSTSIGKDVYSQTLSRYNPIKREYVEISDGLPTTFSYLDQFSPLNTPYFYRVDVTATDGTQASFNSGTVTATYSDWIVANQSKRISPVVQSFNSDYQSKAEYHEPLGRSRSISYRLDNDSRQGNLVLHVSSSERATMLSDIYSIVESDDPAYIVSPFGDVLQVSFESPDVSDDVGGDCRVTMKFVEIGAA